MANTRLATVTCSHCGDLCKDEIIQKEHENFCCQGCLAVYDLLHEKGLEGYYDLEENPGNKNEKTGSESDTWAFLDDQAVFAQLVDFYDQKQVRLRLLVPGIHCSACVWLLEKLYQLNPAVLESRVNFSNRSLSLSYDPSQANLKQIVALLDRLGYAPDLQASGEKAAPVKPYKKLYIKIGIAGFAFGNIMFFSLPEYFGAEIGSDLLTSLFPIMNVLLALPVFFYSAREFFTSAASSLKQASINMDVPISMGLVTLFFYSLYEIFYLGELGYLDSLAALVFFLLLGRLYQQKTYDNLRFDRDFNSFLPLSVTQLKDGMEQSIPLKNCKAGDKLLIRNQELIPADAFLLKGEAQIDYSFVTGESEALPIALGEHIFAGGRQLGPSIEIQVIRDASQSYLAELWNSHTSTSADKHWQPMANKISKYFTATVVVIAFAALSYWLWAGNGHNALKAFTAVLIIACPCALALSAPVSLGSGIRILGKRGIFLKNSEILEALTRINTLVLDKTGTLTHLNQGTVVYEGLPMSTEEKRAVLSLMHQSSHPLSRRIIQAENFTEQGLKVTAFAESPGKGLEAKIGIHSIRVGAMAYVDAAYVGVHLQNDARVHVSINGQWRGSYRVKQDFREGLGEALKVLAEEQKIHLLSGDHDGDYQRIQNLLGVEVPMHFHQKPDEKRAYVDHLMASGKEVMMIGDGLNDAGALHRAQIGMAVSDEIGHFSPASDIIIQGEQLNKLPAIFRFSHQLRRVILIGFLISLIYNVVGVSIAVQALLSPVIAAILMPLSSFTVVLWAMMGSHWLAGRSFEKHFSEHKNTRS